MTNAIAKQLRVLALGCLLAAPSITAAATPGAGDMVDLIGVRVTDVAGKHHRLGVSMGKVQPAVLVFLDTACPVATRYVPTLNELHAEAEARGVALHGVLSNPAITWQASANFVNDFSVAFPVILDSAGDLALRLGPRVPDGSERPLVRIADWDFRWQNTFAYREPVHLPADSRIDAWIRYDNSADNPQNPALEPETVTWGWETTDEMSELWIGFIPDSPADRQRIESASERSWYRPAQASDAEIAQLLMRLPGLN